MQGPAAVFRSKQKAPVQENALKMSFENGKAAELTPSSIAKLHQSGFVTYLRFCSSGKDESAASQASSVLKQYQSLSPDQKKQLICSFFKLVESRVASRPYINIQ